MRLAITVAVLLAAAGAYRPGCGGHPPSAPPLTCDAEAAGGCAGKAYGADCTVEGCGPSGPGHCDEQGTCVAGPPPPTGAAYDPCAGKACGERCATCPPHEPGCVETAELKACDASGRCVSATPSLACPR